MPNQRKEGTRRRTIAIEDTLWDAAAEAAKAEGTTRSEVCRGALVALVERQTGVPSTQQGAAAAG